MGQRDEAAPEQRRVEFLGGPKDGDIEQVAAPPVLYYVVPRFEVEESTVTHCYGVYELRMIHFPPRKKSKKLLGVPLISWETCDSDLHYYWLGDKDEIPRQEDHPGIDL